jgi:poly-gamma-glutamate synthesis protein (capsule biosynthesis protein)
MVRLCAVGDIGLSGRVSITAKRDGADTLLAEVAPVLQTADITLGNLESSLTGEIAPGKLFAAPVTGATSLRKAGFSLIHLANNHVGDYGQRGIRVTVDEVRNAGMTPLGAGEDMASARQLVRTDVNGVRIGWLGCGRTLVPQSDSGPQYWELDEDELLIALAEGRSAVDMMIVSIHAGLMFLDYPHPDQKRMAERLMSAGADLVLMHHPHVLQGIEINDRGCICCFSLGNFLWDNLEGDIHTDVMENERHEGAVFVCDLDRRGVASLAALPTWIDRDCRVRWAVGDRGERILRRLRDITIGLNKDYRAKFDCQRVQRNYGHILRYLVFHASRGHWRTIADQLLRIRFDHVKHLIQYVCYGLQGKLRTVNWKDSR